MIKAIFYAKITKYFFKKNRLLHRTQELIKELSPANPHLFLHFPAPRQNHTPPHLQPYKRTAPSTPSMCASPLTTLQPRRLCCATINKPAIPKSFAFFLISLLTVAASSQSSVVMQWISDSFLTMRYSSSKSTPSLIAQPFNSARQHSGV